MKAYFKRLKTHSGWGMLFPVILLAMIAGSGNKSFEPWWYGTLFGAISGFLFCLFVILLTNEKPR